MENLNKLKELGKEVKKCNIFDPNINDVFNNYIIFANGKHKVKIFASTKIYKIEIQDFNSEISFAINAKDKVCLLNIPIVKQPSGIPTVYISFNYNDNLIINWLENKKNIDLIKELHIKSAEILVIYKNSIIFYSSTLNNLQEKIGKLYGIINGLSLVNDVTYIDFKNVPDKIKPLIPLINEWAISDDFLRNEKINDTSEFDRNKLLEMVYPLLGQIDEYISKYKEPLPIDAILLGNLAETISELKRISK